jgi:hypothetical protein
MYSTQNPKKVLQNKKWHKTLFQCPLILRGPFQIGFVLALSKISILKFDLVFIECLKQ